MTGVQTCALPISLTFSGRIYRFFAEIDDPLDDRYVSLLTDGSNGAYGYLGVEPSEETKRAA